MSFEEFDPGGVAEPLGWSGHYVYIHSTKSIGYVSGSKQNGRPAEATITVSLVEDNGHWSHRSASVVYTMPGALEDLSPDICWWIEEEP